MCKNKLTPVKGTKVTNALARATVSDAIGSLFSFVAFLGQLEVREAIHGWPASLRAFIKASLYWLCWKV